MKIIRVYQIGTKFFVSDTKTGALLPYIQGHDLIKSPQTANFTFILSGEALKPKLKLRDILRTIEHGNLEEVEVIGTKADDLRVGWCMESMRDGGTDASVVVNYRRNLE